MPRGLKKADATDAPRLVAAVTYATFKGFMAHEVLGKYARMFRGFDLAFERLLVASGPGGRRPLDRSAPHLPRTVPSAAATAQHGDGGSAAAAPPGVTKPALLAFFEDFEPHSDPEFVSRLFDVWDVDGRGVILRDEFRRLLVNFARLHVERIQPLPAPPRHRAPSIFPGRFLLTMAPRGEPYPRGSFAQSGSVELAPAPMADLIAARAAAAALARSGKPRTYSMAAQVLAIDERTTSELLEVLEMPPPPPSRKPSSAAGAPAVEPAPASASSNATRVVANPLTAGAPRDVAIAPGPEAPPRSAAGAAVSEWGAGRPPVRLSSVSLILGAIAGSSSSSSAAGGADPESLRAAAALQVLYPPGINPRGWRAAGIRLMRLAYVTLLFDAVVLFNTVAILVELSLASDDPAGSPYAAAVAAMVIVQYAMLLMFIVCAA